MTTSPSRQPTLDPWAPVVEGGEEEACLTALAGITAVVAEGATDDGPGDASLAGGDTGAALLLAYLSASQPERGQWEAVRHRLARALDIFLSEERPGASLYSGLSGLGWVLAHCHRLGGDVDAGACTDIDEALHDLLEGWDWDGDYDLVSGLVGIGVYWLERWPEPAAAAGLESVVARLEQGAEPAREGCTWYTPPDLLYPEVREAAPGGFYNLGVAHGVPGVLGFLGAAYAAGVERARPLLDGAVDWLLSQRLPPGGPSTFPFWHAPGVPARPARSAWCYGDPGVAAALLTAADRAGRHDWRQEALAIARRAAARLPETTGVEDASLCHGAAGLGHIYHRIFRSSAEDRFADAARYWLVRAAAEWASPQGAQGGPAAGFLEGAAGVGLALLAATSAVEPAWDAVLLLSSPV